MNDDFKNILAFSLGVGVSGLGALASALTWGLGARVSRRVRVRLCGAGAKICLDKTDKKTLTSLRCPVLTHNRQRMSVAGPSPAPH